MKKVKSKTSRAEEAAVNYASKRIVVSSLMQQESDNYQYWISLTPEQRLQNVTALMEEIYKDELAKPTVYSRIVFDSI